MRRESHVRACEGGGVRFPSATRRVVGFQHETDARRFWDAMRERLQEFALSADHLASTLHADGGYLSVTPSESGRVGPVGIPRP
jgi:hypothetical protein